MSSATVLCPHCNEHFSLIKYIDDNFMKGVEGYMEYPWKCTHCGYTVLRKSDTEPWLGLIAIEPSEAQS